MRLHHQLHVACPPFPKLVCRRRVIQRGTRTTSALHPLLTIIQPAILTTMDITTDGFGFMLSIGDLAWVPFVYSLQARYLAFTHVEFGPAYTALVFLTHAMGYYIFRTANGEKNDFRNGRNPKSACTLN
jgi:Ergosterol biosynthesis ERG4/ERG24 family